MTALMRWETARLDPAREFEEISERMSRLIGRPNGDRETMKVADWAPKVDVAEDDKEFLIKAEIPEVDKEQVKVAVQDGVLTIQGERKKEVTDKRYHRVERFYGSFYRSFALPENVDERAIKAEFKKGLLAVHLPKSEKAPPKSTEIKVE